MKILLMNAFPPPLGGAEEHVADVDEILRDAGHEVDLVAPGLARTAVHRLTDRFHNGRVETDLTRRLAADRPDVVHIHNFMRTLSAAPFEVAAAAGVPTVWTAHDYQLFCPRTWAIRADGSPCERPEPTRCIFGGCRGSLSGIGGRLVYAVNAVRRQQAARTVGRTASTIVAPAHALAGRLTAVFGRPVDVLPYPFPPVTAGAAPWPERKGLLFAGRVAREKGLAEFVTALASVPDARLTVVGDGPDLDRVRRAAEPAGERIEFVGRLPREEVARSMHQHRALVVPSLWMENSPLSIHEALACGLPVLGSDRGGIPELVDDQNGIVFDPLDRDSVLTAISRATAWTRTEWERRSAAAARRAAAGGASVFLERLLATYADAIGARR